MVLSDITQKVDGCCRATAPVAQTRQPSVAVGQGGVCFTVRALSYVALLFIFCTTTHPSRADEKAASNSTVVVEDQDAETLFQQGRAHLRGDGATQDDVRARALFKRAAEQGHLKAMNNLGMMCADGRGGDKNIDEAIRWLTKPAEQGIALSQYNLGLFRLKGEGAQKDVAQAVSWLEKAAEQGLVEAQVHLGLLHWRGEEGMERNYDAAVKWLTPAASLGDPRAQNALGVAYERGYGAPEDLSRAVEMFRKSAEQGDPKGQSNLGRLYSLGKGVEHDMVKAYQWLALSTEQNEATAANLLADFRRGMTAEQIAEGERLVEEFRTRSRK